MANSLCREEVKFDRSGRINEAAQLHNISSILSQICVQDLPTVSDGFLVSELFGKAQKDICWVVWELSSYCGGELNSYCLWMSVQERDTRLTPVLWSWCWYQMAHLPCCLIAACSSIQRLADQQSGVAQGRMHRCHQDFECVCLDLRARHDRLLRFLAWLLAPCRRHPADI